MKSAPAAPTPYATLKLPVGEGHTLHVEEYGNPEGIPVINLHGGPGSRSKPSHVTRFPLKTYRVILFDQRGCGQSTSKKGPLHANTTQHLLEDIEKIRTYLNIEKWVVGGSSWGSALSLLYAEAHPQRVLGLLVSAIFTATKHEVEDWFADPNGLARFYPQEYATLATLLGNPPKSKFFEALLKALTGPRAHALKVGRAQGMLDGLSMDPALTREVVAEWFTDTSFLTNTQLWAHYAANNFFIKPEQIRKNLTRLKNMPIHILHGEQDLCCPAESAFRLHAALPQSTLTMIPQCPHLGTPAMDKARYKASVALAKILKKPSRKS